MVVGRKKWTSLLDVNFVTVIKSKIIKMVSVTV